MKTDKESEEFSENNHQYQYSNSCIIFQLHALKLCHRTAQINAEMIHKFTEENISNIAGILGIEPKKSGSVYRFEITDREAGRKLALEIHMGMQIDDDKTNLISVYTQDTFLQLHNCTAFVASELLHQITFFGKDGSKISGLIVEKEAGCSLYANVNESLLSGDFTKLPPEVMMCSVALSLTESVDFEDFNFDDE